MACDVCYMILMEGCRKERGKEQSNGRMKDFLTWKILVYLGTIFLPESCGQCLS